MSSWRIIEGDCLEVMRTMPDHSVGSIVTDPPAGINFMNKPFDSDRGGRGPWIAWLTSILTECYRVLKPGGYALVWALPRTSHWTGMAIEDAGFTIKDSLHHLVGSGFPKSLDIGKAIDKAAGAEREVVGLQTRPDGTQRPNMENWAAATSAVYAQDAWTKTQLNKSRAHVTAPATDLARQWDGYGTALKPAHEKWILAQKMPDYATIGANLLAWEGVLCELLAGNAEPSSPPPPASSSEAWGNTARSVAPTSTEASPANRTPIGEAGATNSAAATSASTLESTSIALNMISSWRRIWDDACDLASRSTIATASSLTTDLTTWSLSLCRLTLPTIIAALTNPAESIASVSTAEQLSHAVASKLSAIRALSVPVSAIGQGPHTGQGAAEASPAHEVWWLAQKPLDGTYAANVARHGVGALNIDASRVGLNGEVLRPFGSPKKSVGGILNTDNSADREPFVAADAGRWPTNLLLTHHPDCRPVGERRMRVGANGGSHAGTGAFPIANPDPVGYADADGMETIEAWECHESCPISILDVQSGTLTSNGGYGPGRVNAHAGKMGYGGSVRDFQGGIYGDSGGASRFFPTFRFEADDFAPWLYCAKASRSERERGLQTLRQATPGERTDRKEGSAGLDSPRAGAGRTSAGANLHPTVKPLKLMSWLVRLITPPGETVLDPFAGSFTTGIACLREGRAFVGIEQERQYFTIGVARMQAAAREIGDPAMVAALDAYDTTGTGRSAYQACLPSLLSGIRDKA